MNTSRAEISFSAVCPALPAAFHTSTSCFLSYADYACKHNTGALDPKELWPYLQFHSIGLMTVWSIQFVLSLWFLIQSLMPNHYEIIGTCSVILLVFIQEVVHVAETQYFSVCIVRIGRRIRLSQSAKDLSLDIHSTGLQITLADARYILRFCCITVTTLYRLGCDKFRCCSLRSIDFVQGSPFFSHGVIPSIFTQHKVCIHISSFTCLPEIWLCWFQGIYDP